MSNSRGIKMRPVTADKSMRKSYNKALDEDNTNPYSSMYQQAFGAAHGSFDKQRVSKNNNNTTIV